MSLLSFMAWMVVSAHCSASSLVQGAPPLGELGWVKVLREVLAPTFSVCVIVTLLLLSISYVYSMMSP